MPKLIPLFTAVFLAALGVALSAQYAGWTIPDSAKDEKNPVAVTPAVLTNGKALYAKNCLRCHGAEGKGDGPRSNPDSPAADLTDDYRTSLNPDGVLYYRIANGHPPEMPAFEKIITNKNDIWAVVAYIKTLRKP